MQAAFADISEFELICEVKDRTAGYNPEFFYGSHIFQDLVETEILYTAVFANEKTRIFSPEKLKELSDITSAFLKKDDNLPEGIVRVFSSEGHECELYHDLENARLVLLAE